MEATEEEGSALLDDNGVEAEFGFSAFDNFLFDSVFSDKAIHCHWLLLT